jgi:hypothetical protein
MRPKAMVSFFDDKARFVFPGADRFPPEYRYSFLNAFYVFPNGKFRAYATAEELAAFRGLGRSLLCMFLSLIGQEHFVAGEKSRWFLLLEASGGIAHPKRVEELRMMGDEAVWKRLIHEFPDEAVDLVMDAKQDPDVFHEAAEVLASCEDNMKLIDYYRNTYGFQLADAYCRNGALMIADVETVMSNCGI